VRNCVFVTLDLKQWEFFFFAFLLGLLLLSTA